MTLVRASEVFGSQAEAGAWMSRAATGLDGHRSIELLQTLQGAEVLTDFLVRLEHCVYS